MSDMLASGYLHNDECLHLKSGIAKATLLANGKIRLDNGEIHDIHKGAALANGSKAARLMASMSGMLNEAII